MSEPWEDLRAEYRHDATLDAREDEWDAERAAAHDAAVPSRCCGMNPCFEQPDPGRPKFTTAVCPECWDGEPITAEGRDPWEAVENWNEEQHDGK